MEGGCGVWREDVEWREDVREDVECGGKMWREDVEGGCGVWRNEMKGT